ncbi:hypothetical protein GH741_11390 [Aquibacillus halophilus]|uniref:Uncharacterized protein n=1 Tax=Aquibacillus halophilus TaxID=930132 RepID=A0A6A8DC70_9BACI|nr:hypothetical protein [Aquibacillus halophilus]MRH43283.1 hypothetical protein [Aquibacillus halophilus]
MRFGIYFALIIVLFGLTGCTDSDNQVIFSGKSKHWDVEIVKHKETGLSNIHIDPKNIDEENLKQIEISIDREQRHIGLEIELIKKDERITHPIPSDMLEDYEGSIEVTVSWDFESPEEIELVSR